MVCSTQILDQIGGTEGHKLPDLDASQLLDLVAWVENFRETIEESFPNIGDHTAKKTYFDKKPDLLQDSVVNMDVAKDSLAWANNMLWEVHDLAKDEFLFRTKEQTDEWLDNVYMYVFVCYRILTNGFVRLILARAVTFVILSFLLITHMRCACLPSTLFKCRAYQTANFRWSSHDVSV